MVVTWYLEKELEEYVRDFYYLTMRKFQLYLNLYMNLWNHLFKFRTNCSDSAKDELQFKVYE